MKLIDADIIINNLKSHQKELSVGSGNREYNFLEMIINGLKNEPAHFDMEMVLDQLEDYGKYKGVLRLTDGKNYIPVSVAKKIVKSRGVGGVLGYMEEN